MQAEADNKMKGKAENLFMSKWAWDLLNELRDEQVCYPKKGRGRLVEDMLLKEKLKRDKRKSLESDLSETA